MTLRISVLPLFCFLLLVPALPVTGQTAGKNRSEVIVALEQSIVQNLPITGGRVSFGDAPQVQTLNQALAAFEVKSVSPAIPKIMRDGESWQQRVAKIQARFPQRTSRATPGAKIPDLSRTYVVTLDNDAAATACAAALRQIPGVVYVGQNRRLLGSRTPNDTYYKSSGTWGQDYEDLYGLKRIRAEKAWDEETGDEDIIIAIVDSGIDDRHEDLRDNIWINTGEIPDNGEDDDDNGFIDDETGWDFTCDCDYQKDDYGHGSWVGGIAGATGDNGKGIVGVTWRCKLMNVKARDKYGIGTALSFTNGVIYATDNGADVINLSAATLAKDPLSESDMRLLRDAIDYAYGLGVVVISAAGNEHADLSKTPVYPASYHNHITVGATDPEDDVADFSNFGPEIDVCAPGYDVLSCLADDSEFKKNGYRTLSGKYVRGDGTSASAPFVSGLVALLLSSRPELSVEQIRQILRVTAHDIDKTGWDTKSGYGRIDAEAALELQNPCAARILSPQNYEVIFGATPIIGLANGGDFERYKVQYARASKSNDWTTISESDNGVPGATLATWNTALLPGDDYILRLVVFDKDANVYEDRIFLTIDNSSLPVELVSLSAAANENVVQLAWTTATETNNFGFEIQRKQEGLSFGRLGFVRGHLTTTAPQHYAYNDTVQTPGAYVYRLKQIDVDGASEISGEVSATVHPPEHIQLLQNYPNPFNGATKIDFRLNRAGQVEIAIYNVLGARVATLLDEPVNAGFHTVSWDGTNAAGRGAASGVYLVILRGGGQQVVQKMIYQR